MAGVEDDKWLGPPMIGALRDVVAYRGLLYMLTWRDIKVKYKQSIMGFMWAILMPTLIVSAGILVRLAFSHLSGKPLQLEEVAAVSVRGIPWAFVVAGIRFSTTSLISNEDLITKIYFPRELFPIAATLSQFFDFTIAAGVLTLVLGVARIGLSPQLFWLPLLVCLLFLLVLSFAFLLSALALFFRDVKYLVEVVLTFGVFFTPVFYDVAMFGKYAPILLLNPLAPLLEAFDASIVRQRLPELGWLAYSAVFSLLACVLSWTAFKKLEPDFAENI